MLVNPQIGRAVQVLRGGVWIDELKLESRLLIGG